jgi:hypothetical protein
MLSVKLIEPSGYEHITECVCVIAEPPKVISYEKDGITRISSFRVFVEDEKGNVHTFGEKGMIYVMNAVGTIIAEYFLGRGPTE